MGQRYTFNYLWMLLIALAISMNLAFIGPGKQAKADTIYARKAKKPSYLKNGLPTGNLPQVKTAPYAVKPSSPPASTDKLLTNVQVYPNMVTDQINVKYMISRNSLVTIKIVDVLGNSVATLWSDRVDSGERQLNANLNNKLTSGFYFLRVTVGTESVIKRITVL
jgi:hypothetical protein